MEWRGLLAAALLLVGFFFPGARENDGIFKLNYQYLQGQLHLEA